jgi:integrase
MNLVDSIVYNFTLLSMRSQTFFQETPKPLENNEKYESRLRTGPVSRGGFYYRRVKTQKSFWRPMNRTVRQHLKSLCPVEPNPDSPVFHGGGTRPNSRFRDLCKLAGVSLKRDIESGEEQEWVLKDLRKTCATHYDEHMPESSIEILGHSAGGIT